jgi:hypothetical protein
MDTQTQQLLQQLGLTANNTSGAMQQLITALGRASAANTGNANAATLSSQAMQQLQGSATATTQKFSSFLGVGTSFVGSLTGLTSSIYGADKAFTSVIPTLDAITSIFNKFTGAVGQALSGTSFLGVSFGRASEAVASGATAMVDLLTQQVKFQLESAQKVADQFLALSKAGANYGASISSMGAQAAKLRIPLFEFGRIITTNVENLTKMGKRVEDAGYEVANYSASIYDSSDALVALYGNIENISVGVSNFLALQAQLGLTDNKRRDDFNKQREAIQEYLIRQKELTSLTGQSADARKKEEEERRRDLAYKQKLGRMSDTARLNTEEAFAIATSKFGTEAGQYLMELVRTEGKVIDPAMIAFGKGNQLMANTMEMFYQNINLASTDFRRTYAGFISANKDAYKGFVDSVENLAELPPSLMNNFVLSQIRTASKLVDSANFIEQIGPTVERLIKEGGDISGVLTDAATKAFVDAERDRNRIQREIDKTVLDNIKKIGPIMDYLNSITLSMVQSQQSITTLLENLKKIPTTPDQLKESLGKIIDEMVRRLGIDIPQTQRNRLRDLLPEGGNPLPVSVVPGQNPIPVSIATGQNGGRTPTSYQADPSTPSNPGMSASAQSAAAQLVAYLSNKDQDSQTQVRDQNTALAAEVERLKGQLVALTGTNSSTEQLVAAVVNQTGIMEKLNNRMDDMVASNGKIFEALA